MGGEICPKMEFMGDIINSFIARTSNERVRCWLEQSLKTLLEKVSSAKGALRRM